MEYDRSVTGIACLNKVLISEYINNPYIYMFSNTTSKEAS